MISQFHRNQQADTHGMNSNNTFFYSIFCRFSTANHYPNACYNLDIAQAAAATPEHSENGATAHPRLHGTRHFSTLEKRRATRI